MSNGIVVVVSRELRDQNGVFWRDNNRRKITRIDLDKVAFVWPGMNIGHFLLGARTRDDHIANVDFLDWFPATRDQGARREAVQVLVSLATLMNLLLLLKRNIRRPMGLGLHSGFPSSLRPTGGAGLKCSPPLFVREVGLTEFLTTQGTYNRFRLRGAWQ